jgi:hypothetical protein
MLQWLHTYVVSVCSKCFSRVLDVCCNCVYMYVSTILDMFCKCFIQMLQEFCLNVVKVDLNVDGSDVAEEMR